MSPCPCLYFFISIFPCLQIHVSMTPFLQVSMSHVYVSMFLCLHVSGIPQTELMENGNFHLFDVKAKLLTSVCCYALCPCLHLSGIPQTEPSGKQQLAYVCCKQKMANFCLFAANGNRKRKFVFLCRQMINSY